MKEQETVRQARARLFDEVERWQGASFISDDEDHHSGSWEELANYCDFCAYEMQQAIRVCRAMARTSRRRAEKKAAGEGAGDE